MTTINLGNIRFNWRGQYDSKTTYNKDDVVSYKGSSFIAKKQLRALHQPLAIIGI